MICIIGFMKRAREEDESYSGSRGLEILELLLFHGFDMFPHIVTCSKASKALHSRALGKVFVPCSMQTCIILKGCDAHISGQYTHLPTRTLLKVHPNLNYLETTFDPPVLPENLLHVCFTITVDSKFVMVLSYDESSKYRYNYQTFLDPSYITPSMEKIKTATGMIKIIKIRMK